MDDNNKEGAMELPPKVVLKHTLTLERFCLAAHLENCPAFKVIPSLSNWEEVLH